MPVLPGEQSDTSDIPELTERAVKQGCAWREVSTCQETGDHASRCGWDSLAQVARARLSDQGKSTTARRDAALAGARREAPAVVRDKDCAKARRASKSTPPARVGATFAGSDCSRTHDFNPRFGCLSRLFKDLGGHLKLLKLFKTQHNVALKGWRRRFNSVPGHH